mgnify:CR=1 FL=1
MYYTQGYNPHIYLSFSCPLSLGQESLCESCEVKTEQEMIDGEVWKKRFAAVDAPRHRHYQSGPGCGEGRRDRNGCLRRHNAKKAAWLPSRPTTMLSRQKVTKKDQARPENAGPQAVSEPYRLRGSRGQHRVLGQAALRQRRSTEPESLAADGLFTAARRRTHLAVPCPANASYNKSGVDFE